MNLQMIFQGPTVALSEMLDAREARAFRQAELLKRGHDMLETSQTDTSMKKTSTHTEYKTSQAGTPCLISFSMNIAGEIKSFPLCLSAFNEGLDMLHSRLSHCRILHVECSRKPTGPEAFFLLCADAEEIKFITASIEESHPLGRLFDMDVLDSKGRSVSRTGLGFPPRTCLICDRPAKECARSRNHTLEVIRWRTAQLLHDYYKGKTADAAASCAIRALLYEVSATPKPGLVDRSNSGSHKDMDFFTFLDSSASLIPWFRDFFCIGWDFCLESDAQIFSRLRCAGQEAETRMFAAAGGVNTHKGLIFAAAVILGALGKYRAFKSMSEPPESVSPNRTSAASPAIETSDMSAVIQICQAFAAHALQDFQQNPSTAGEQFYHIYGISGARGEAAAGFPSARIYGLPALRLYRSRGYSLNDSAVLTLITLIAHVTDTNMIRRGGMEAAEQCKKEAQDLLSAIDSEGAPTALWEPLAALDRSYIERSLSPGGCADLLAVSLLFLFLEEDGLL